jgi:hypothetical protein
MTVGLSPKVIAAIVAALAGLIVTVIGALADDESILMVGVGLLGGGGVSAVGGYAAPPGEVVQEVGPASDELLPTVPRDLREH